MIRSSIIMVLAVFFMGTVSANNGDPVSETVTYKVNTDKSNIVWKGHKITGTHTGTLNISNGNLYVKNGVLIGGSFEVNMTSLTVTDLQPGKGKEKLEGHLKSDDFFAADKFKTSKLVVTKISQTKNEDEYILTGDLTIKGNTEQIMFKANISDIEGSLTANAVTKIDRSKYDVQYGSKTFFENIGDKVIYDEFDLEIELVLTK